MKTTLDGVVFLLPHVSSHAKTEFHRRRIFPGPREGRGNGMRRPAESCRTRTVGRQDEAAEQGGRTGRQDGAAGRSGRTGRQDGAAGRGGRTGRQKKRGGEATSSQRTGPGAPPAQTKKRDSNRREPPDSEKAHGEAARHLQKANDRFSIRCSDTGKGAILSARPPLVK